MAGIWLPDYLSTAGRLSRPQSHKVWWNVDCIESRRSQPRASLGKKRWRGRNKKKKIFFWEKPKKKKIGFFPRKGKPHKLKEHINPILRVPIEAKEKHSMAADLEAIPPNS